MNNLNEMDVQLNYIFWRNNNYVLETITDECNGFKRAIKCCFIKVRPYTAMDDIPEIFAYDTQSSLQTKEELNLEEWVKAISVKGQIHLFTGFFESNCQEDILNHEMFHCGVYQCMKSQYLIPRWFNEAVAHFIGNNTQIGEDVSVEIKKLPVDALKRWVKEDTLIEKCSLGYEIIKSLGNYFGNAFDCNTIRRMIDETRIEKDFDMVFSKFTLLSTDEFLERWLDNLT